ncbi:hypothetical protein JHK82_049944 [Glycine max]|nr:hypothetical protein JHK82_049944 [Glycine max]
MAERSGVMMSIHCHGGEIKKERKGGWGDEGRGEGREKEKRTWCRGRGRGKKREKNAWGEEIGVEERGKGRERNCGIGGGERFSWKRKKEMLKMSSRGCDPPSNGTKGNQQRNIRGKGSATSSPIVNLSGTKVAIREKTVVTKMLAKAKETENMAVLYEIMIKHISAMYEEQRMNHKISSANSIVARSFFHRICSSSDSSAFAPPASCYIVMLCSTSREDKLTLAKNKEKLSRNVKLFQQEVFDTRASLQELSSRKGQALSAMTTTTIGGCALYDGSRWMNKLR